MIDWKKTEERYGYTEKDLAKTSRNPVVFRCDNENCQAAFDIREREYEYNYIRQKEAKAKKENKQSLCQKCSHSHRVGKVSQKREKSHQPLPPEVSVEKTMEKYGYDPYSLPNWSRKKIVLVYEGNEYETTRAQINRNKSIIETGHYKPIAFYTQKRRKNLKVSSETKALMKESQQKRREKERKVKEDLIDISYLREEKKVS